jgi:hypothetical protein
MATYHNFFLRVVVMVKWMKVCAWFLAWELLYTHYPYRRHLTVKTCSVNGSSYDYLLYLSPVEWSVSLETTVCHLTLTFMVKGETWETETSFPISQTQKGSAQITFLYLTKKVSHMLYQYTSSTYLCNNYRWSRQHFLWSRTILTLWSYL